MTAQALLSAQDAGGGGGSTVNVTISTTQPSLVNLFTLAGSPAGAVTCNLTINSGVVLEAGLTEGAFVGGSTVNIYNSGVIAGTGGAGDEGGIATAGNLSNGFSAGAGGDAINVTVPTVIDNGSGYILGGGGGGGGGESAANSNPPGADRAAAGGGGGGGQGYNNAAGGAGGTANAGVARDGTAGTAGSSTTSGGGGLGGEDAPALIQAGNGGVGGGWGQDGGDGTAASGGTFKSGYAGRAGAAGYAIRKNGNSVTFTAGNNGTQVVGTVA